jgi:hypothetical protein
VGPAHPKILLAHPRIKVKHIKNKIHLQYLSIICLWFKIWPTPAKNHCYALDSYTERTFIFYDNFHFLKLDEFFKRLKAHGMIYNLFAGLPTIRNK